MATTNNRQTTGDCECCDRTDIVVTLMHGNMHMCDECIAREVSATAAIKTVDDARKVDESIEIKQDVWNAATVPFIELKAAIDNNPTVPADQKDYALVKEASSRIDRMTAAIFAQEAEIMKLKNERHAWLTNVQVAASKLRADIRAQFKQYDVNYQPAPITKKSKSATPVKSPKTFAKEEVNTAAKKYNVPASAVQMIILSKNISAEEAAKLYAQMTATK